MAYINKEDYIEWLNSPRGRAFTLINRYNYIDKKYNRETPDMDVNWIIENILNSKCYYCGCTDYERKLGMDRIDNTKGHIKDNVVPCCADCNNKRQWRESKDKNNPLTILRNKRISEARMGHSVSEETKIKISKSNSGKKISEETKKKISQANIGKHNIIHTDKTKEKMSKAHSKPCIAKDENGNILFIFSSTIEAKQKGFTQSKVSSACRNDNCGTNKYKGLYWYFLS